MPDKKYFEFDNIKIEKNLLRKLGIGIMLFFIGIFFVIPILGSLWTIVPAGHVGISDTLGNVSDQTLESGFYLKEPWRNIVAMTFQTQPFSAKASSASSDLQDVSAQITINYRLDKSRAVEVYRTNGISYAGKVIPQAVQEGVKASTAGFTAEELITRRETVRNAIENSIHEKLLRYGIIVEAVAITDFDFSDSFNQAIEAKVTAEQRALEAKNQLEQIKIEKEQTITKAEALAESIRLKADADAYSLKVIQEELLKSQQLISYKSIEKWNGVLPLVSGSSSGLLINFPIGDHN